jgi:NAD(P)-dependent dehydrogenase (short-subunit alcohol dehydrogenase family)
MNGSSKQALIIGASRGLGLGLARELLGRGWQVVATVRKPSEGLEALRAEAADKLKIETVDIDRPEEVQALRRRLDGSRFDLLFVNAGVSGSSEKTISQVSHDEFVREMTTNAFSPARAAEALGDLVKPGGTVGFMSSVLGSIASNTSAGFEVYRASKAALNMLVRSLIARHADKRWTVLLLHPGWVSTDMGGPQAPVDVPTSVRGLADVIEARHGTGGVAFLDYQGKELPW